MWLLMVSFPTVFTGAATDVEAVRDFMRPIVEPWIEQAWIAIVDPTAKTVTQNSVTGVTTDVSITPLWTGYARVQPLRTDITVKKAVDSTTQRTVQFWPSAWPEGSAAWGWGCGDGEYTSVCICCTYVCILQNRISYIFLQLHSSLEFRIVSDLMQKHVFFREGLV